MGEPLTQAQYDGLTSSRRDVVIGDGDLIRMRFASRIFVQGSNLIVAVRSTNAADLWQEAQAQDVTSLKPGRTLEIQALGAQKVVDEVEVAPNPFTPNDDGINDQTEIKFTLFKLHEARPVTLSLFRLDGQRVRQMTVDAAGGLVTMVWDGRDDVGKLVMPGLYVATINAAIIVAGDAGDLSPAETNDFQSRARQVSRRWRCWVLGRHAGSAGNQRGQVVHTGTKVRHSQI